MRKKAAAAASGERAAEGSSIHTHGGVRHQGPTRKRHRRSVADGGVVAGAVARVRPEGSCDDDARVCWPEFPE
jgi:hypothetical protein